MVGDQGSGGADRGGQFVCSRNRFVAGMVALGACVCLVLAGLSVADDRVATPVGSDGDYQPPQRVLSAPVMRGAGVGQ